MFVLSKAELTSGLSSSTLFGLALFALFVVAVLLADQTFTAFLPK